MTEAPTPVPQDEWTYAEYGCIINTRRLDKHDPFLDATNLPVGTMIGDVQFRTSAGNLYRDHTSVDETILNFLQWPGDFLAKMDAVPTKLQPAYLVASTTEEPMVRAARRLGFTSIPQEHVLHFVLVAPLNTFRARVETRSKRHKAIAERLVRRIQR